MAHLRLFLAATLVSVACGFKFGHFLFAGFPWTMMDDDAGFPAFGPPMMALRFPAPPKAPLLMNPFPFPMPTMRFPPMPSPAEILSAAPGTGTYNGVIVTTQHESKRLKNGTITQTGGSTIVINDNGNVTINKSGDAPPEVVTSSSERTNSSETPVNQDSNFDPSQPKHRMFKPLEMKQFAFKSLDPEIIKDHKPKDGSQFSSFSKRTYTKVEDTKEKIKGEITANSLVNETGNLTEENVINHNDDKA